MKRAYDATPSEQVPDGIPPVPPRRSYSTDRVGPFVALPASQRTFEVSPRHESLPNGGVRFAVESVSPAAKEDKCKPVLAAGELHQAQQATAERFYAQDESRLSGRRFRTAFTPMRIEASAEAPGGLVHAGADGFIVAVLTAFARHLPLALSPDHIWALISTGFARHVDANAEALRENFVQHQVKKRLEVAVDHFEMGGGKPGCGTPAELWQRDVFPCFSEQIRAHIGDRVHSAIAGGFSTTDAASQAAHEVTLMSAMKSYFSFGMTTCCGIPEVSLLGTLADWQAVRARTEQLGKLMVPDFADRWLPVLLPVLDQFVLAYQGQVNYGFWQSMVKLRNTGGGSGSYSFISGWVQLLYPYRAHGLPASDFRPWEEMYFTGPQLDELPPVLSSCPVDWNYHGTTYDLHFHAGIAGVTQDPEDGTLTPLLGWFVSHDPPEEPQSRLEWLRSEAAALRAGHESEPECGPWAKRLSVLEHESEVLQVVVDANARQSMIDQLREKYYKARHEEHDLVRAEVIKTEMDALSTEQTEATKYLKSAVPA